MTREMAILWIHETVGDYLDGDASLDQCCAWIRYNGTKRQRARLIDAEDALNDE